MGCRRELTDAARHGRGVPRLVASASATRPPRPRPGTTCGKEVFLRTPGAVLSFYSPRSRVTRRGVGHRTRARPRGAPGGARHSHRETRS
jgi:hypothetical protein